MSSINKSNGILLCEQAFERLKAGKPKVLLTTNYQLDCITSSLVSQEAGFDSGYLKNSRKNHRALIHEISEFKKRESVRTPEGKKRISDLNAKIESKNQQVNKYEGLYKEALSREVVLVARLTELESKIRSLESINVLRLKSI